MTPTTVTLACDAILFDLDGVLVDSTECCDHTWRVWAAEHGLDGDAIVAMSHGRRGVETLRAALPSLDDAAIAAEMATLIAREERETVGVREVPGAAALIASLPPGQWAIVTSGVRAVAEHRLRYVGLPVPPVMICADDIAIGKPHPMGYRTAAERLGIAPESCLVIEDAPAGLAAARAAGMRAVAITATHTPSALRDATVIATALSAVTVSGDTRSASPIPLHVSVAAPLAMD